MSFRIRDVADRHIPVSVARAGAFLLVLGLAACGGGGGGSNAVLPSAVTAPAPESTAAAGVDCLDFDFKTVTIKSRTITVHNNSAGTIYPVISTSANSVNEWVQACRRTRENYPTKYVYKLYVNEGTGIAPGSSVEVTIPLYSQLPDQSYITWWNGGRVLLADRNDRLLIATDANNDKDSLLATPPAGVSCKGTKTDCNLNTYSSNSQFRDSVYAQLSEYTFGAINLEQGTPLFVPDNVGYNISYVDHVYLPVAIAPKNNPYIGYSGSAMPLPDFRSRLSAFLASDAGKGWPVYNLAQVKLPGGYNIFAQRDGKPIVGDDMPVKIAGQINPPELILEECRTGTCSDADKAKPFGEAVQRMQNLWGSCVAWNDPLLSQSVTASVDCTSTPERVQLSADLLKIKLFFEENYNNYKKLACALPDKKFSFKEALQHIYGWVPFDENCGSNVNKLADTRIAGLDHAAAQSLYIHSLQYNYKTTYVAADPKLNFNPYVKLIHGKDGDDANDLHMSAYGFSVDDAVGFMSELGDGLVFTVGGATGLENEKQFTYQDGFEVKIGGDGAVAQNVPLIKSYGVCTQNGTAWDCKQDVVMPTRTRISGFRVGSVPSYPVQVHFTDLDDNVYTFVVNKRFPECNDASCIPMKKSDVDALKAGSQCKVVDRNGADSPRSAQWCVGFDPNQSRPEQVTKNFASFPVPVRFLP